ncbi:MFS transporter [Ferroplasma acidiphilum]|jgi:MFS family permease|uniref:MFS transporter n=1 Tax=Ferroplasma acidiphilum TaxID=74969 RepID=UPI000038E4D5|nr:MFS transporter [Ferroplasma acidiphilum]WMT53660.1 MAG: MFS transporter [Ferroplasma acidiphilum]
MNYHARAGLIYNARALYALNWMDIAPALKYIKSSFDIDLIALGALVTSFYLGIAIFQVVGGLLASYIGDKKTSLTGLLLMGIFAIISGLSTNFTELIISRFFSGLSGAFFLFIDLKPSTLCYTGKQICIPYWCLQWGICCRRWYRNIWMGYT